MFNANGIRGIGRERYWDELLLTGGGGAKRQFNSEICSISVANFESILRG